MLCVFDVRLASSACGLFISAEVLTIKYSLLAIKFGVLFFFSFKMIESARTRTDTELEIIPKENNRSGGCRK